MVLAPSSKRRPRLHKETADPWLPFVAAVLQAFGNPVNNTFDYPPVAGYSYSFTEDGWYEEASCESRLRARLREMRDDG